MKISYLPKGSVIGLSKLARIAEVFSRRLQTQERLTQEVADCIKNIFDPYGVEVIVESVHLCMAMRGVQQASSTTTTRCIRGSMELNEERPPSPLTVHTLPPAWSW